MTERRVKLVRYAPETIDSGFRGAYRMRVEITEVEGPDLDIYLFIYRRGLASAYTGEAQDRFEAVCGPPQLASIPATTPDPDQSWPLFRLNYIELDFISASQAEVVWLQIVADTNALVSGLNKLDNLNIQQEVWCPGPPAEHSQSSASA